VFKEINVFLESCEKSDEDGFHLVSIPSITLNLSHLTLEVYAVTQLAVLPISQLNLKAAGWFDKNGFTHDEQLEIKKIFPHTKIKWV